MAATELGEADGAEIVAAAREAIAEGLGGPRAPTRALPDARAGVFVTLRGPGGLRGCIGLPEAGEPLAEALREAAVAAATRDPRFAPVTAGELGSLAVEVSVLSAPKPLRGPRESYPRAIRPGLDGLIIRRGASRGLLLPQVAGEMSWGAAEFLDGACQKAGLGPRCWLDEGTEVLTFGAAVFGEPSPGARAVRVSP